MGVGKAAAVLTAALLCLPFLPPPAFGDKPSPRCVVVPDRPRQATPGAADPRTVSVMIPRVKCRPDLGIKPIAGGGGGAAAGDGGGDAGGGLPYTGFDLAHGLTDGLLLAGAGILLTLLGRRKRQLARSARLSAS